MGYSPSQEDLVEARRMPVGTTTIFLNGMVVDGQGGTAETVQQASLDRHMAACANIAALSDTHMPMVTGFFDTLDEVFGRKASPLIAEAATQLDSVLAAGADKGIDPQRLIAATFIAARTLMGFKVSPDTVTATLRSSADNTIRALKMGTFNPNPAFA